MWIATVLPMFVAFASAAEYTVVDPPAPPSYVPEKPAPAPISAPMLAIIGKVLEALQGYENYPPPAPPAYGDGVLTEQAYPDADLLKLLNLVYHNKPKKYGPKTTVKILDRLPGVYGGVPGVYGGAPGVYGGLPGVYGGLPGVYGGLPPYALNPALLSDAYKRPALGLGLLHPGYSAQPHVNLMYPSGLPAYHLPLHSAPKLPLGHAGVYGYPGYAPSAYGLPPLPLIIITKGDPDTLKVDDYEDEAATEAPAPLVYAAKPKKPAVKYVAVAKKAASYAPAALKVLPKVVKVNGYAAKAAKAKGYAKVVKVVAPAEAIIKASYPSKAIKAAALYATTAAPIPVSYAEEVIAPAPVAPTYAAVATDAPVVDPYSGVEARSATGGDEGSAKNANSNLVGESARSSLSDHGISSQKTISRIS